MEQAHEYHVRPGRADDARAIADIWTASADEHAAWDSDCWAWADNAVHKYREWIVECLGKDDAGVLVAVDEHDEPAGFTVVQVKDLGSFLAFPRRAQIVWIVVGSAHRLRGLGRMLVKAAAQFGRQHGAHRLSLLVASKNAAAIAFYKALGMESHIQEMYMRL